MSFETILRTVLEDCAGDAVGVALMGPDGIPIEQLEVSGRGVELDPVALGVEFGRILGEAGKASQAVGGGELAEMAVRTESFWLLMRMVDEEYFLLLALEPEANLGKARFVLRRHTVSVQSEL